MEPHRNDLTSAHDLALVDSARAGDRLSFGVLYLRHHAAAWRVACVVSRFSPDAELAVIEGFTRVFSALPPKSEDFAAETVRFRPYLLACVRQAALERARSAGRAAASVAPLAGLAPDGELVLSSLEHHIARGALAALPERSRTALWLSEVEAMTPAEIATIVGGRREDITALVSATHEELRDASRATLVRHEVRAECRFTVAHLEPFQAGTLDPAKGVLVRSHLDLCPTCRMRFAELANGPAALAAAVPAPPLLGGEAQHHFFASLAGIRPADRLLPPGIAAAAPAVPPGQDGRAAAVAVASVASMATAAAGLPARAQRAGRRLVPAVPVVALVAAWLGVMLSLPQLMEPGTAPGPGGGLALPAVQAYVPDYLPGRAESRPGGGSPAALQPSGDVAETAGVGPAGGTELAFEDPELAVRFAATTAGSSPSTPGPTDRPDAPAPAAPMHDGTGAVSGSPRAAAAAVSPATPAAEPAAEPAVEPATPQNRRDKPAKAVKNRQRAVERETRHQTAASSMPKFARPDVASLRSKPREESDGQTARRETRRRHTDHAQSA